MLAGSRGWGAASGLVEGSKHGGCPPQGTGLLGAGRSWRLVLSFQRAEIGRYTWEEQSGAGEAGDSFTGCLQHGGSCFAGVWVRGGFSTCMETSVPSPVCLKPAKKPRSHWESREQTRERGHQPQLLKKPVRGKKTLDTPHPDVLSLPTSLPVPARRSRHPAGPQS